MSKRELRVRDLRTGDMVRRVDVTDKPDRMVERVMLGMLRNMADGFVIDDSADNGGDA